MEKEYTKREVDYFMEEISQTLARIEAQTTKTNGRVNKLENWKSYIQGGMAVIIILILPIIFKLFFK